MTASKPAKTDLKLEVAATRRDSTAEVGQAASPPGGSPGRLVRRKSAEPHTRPPAALAASSVSVLSEAAPSQQSPAPQPTLDRLADGRSAGQAPGVPAQAAFRAAPAGYMGASPVSSGRIGYSVLKRAPDGSFGALAPGGEIQAGDSVQLLLHAPVSGSLVLQEQLAGGGWRTVFPAGGAGLPVSAQREVVIPDSPLQVDGPRHLRLVLTPLPLPASIAFSRAAKSVAQDKQRLQEADVTTQTQGSQGTLVTDVRLAPGKVSTGR